MEQRKTALIVGMAKSGIGAAKLLCRNGYRVIINDQKRRSTASKRRLPAIRWKTAWGKNPHPC